MAHHPDRWERWQRQPNLFSNRYTDKLHQPPAAFSTQLNKFLAAGSANKAHTYRRNPGLRSMRFRASAGLHTCQKRIPPGSGQDQDLRCEIPARRKIVSLVQLQSEKFARDLDGDIRSAKAQSGHDTCPKRALLDFSRRPPATAPCDARCDNGGSGTLLSPMPFHSGRQFSFLPEL